MKLDADHWNRIVATVLPRATTLSADDATAIVQIMDLAAHADLDEDADELAALDAVSRQICAAAGIARDSVPRVSPLPLDGEARIAWIAKLAPRLSSQSTRELAFVAAHLLTVSDLQLAPVEQRFVDELRSELGITEDRARGLLTSVSEVVTPGASELPG